MKTFSDKEKLKYYRLKTKALENALERAYFDIIYFINEGDFKRYIEWDASYIIDLLPRKRKSKPRS